MWLFPATMAVLAGIDLVAKFREGDDPGRVAQRYRRYVADYISADYAKELFQLRNALMHSFGLYSQDRTGRVYQFTLERGNGGLMHRPAETRYVICVFTLWHLFEASLTTFRNELNASEALQAQFAQMFPKYGLLTIGG